MGSDWEFVVEEAFEITGRGVGVFGRLEGEILSSPFSAELSSATGVRTIERVSIEFARVEGGGERIALALWGESTDHVPVGSVLRPGSLMLSERDARQIANEYLDSDVYVITSVEEVDPGWIVYYDSRQHQQTGEFRHSVAGNAPLIVDRDDGSVHITGTAHPVAEYVRQYAESRLVVEEDES